MSQDKRDDNPAEQLITDALRVFSRSMNEMAKDMAPAGAAFWRAMTGMLDADVDADADADTGPEKEDALPPEPPLWSVVTTTSDYPHWVTEHFRGNSDTAKPWIDNHGRRRTWAEVCSLDDVGVPVIRVPEGTD